MEFDLINNGPGTVIEFPKASVPADNPVPEWLDECLFANDKPLNNLANVLIALRSDPVLCGAIALNEMLQRAFLLKALPGDVTAGPFMPRPLADADVTRIQEYLQCAGLRNVGKDIVHSAVDLRAEECKFHPVRDYLNSLKWDGKERLSSWLHHYLGADQTLYAQGVGMMFLISMIARVLAPGCKADYMLVLEGPQGARKSTACGILGGVWFSDNLPDVTGGKDVSQHLAGKWLIEIAEMSAMSKAETANLKAFVTRTIEKYRPPYGRKEVSQPRQCMFIGTTNQSVYLRDETGARRFWPVSVGKIDTDALSNDRDQLFAEARELYLMGVPWHPTAEFELKIIRPEQEARFEADVWEETIREYLKDHEPSQLLVGELLEKAFHVAKEHRSTRSQRRVTAILQRLGWKRLKKDQKGNIPWGPPLHPDAG